MYSLHSSLAPPEVYSGFIIHLSFNDSTSVNLNKTNRFTCSKLSELSTYLTEMGTHLLATYSSAANPWNVHYIHVLMEILKVTCMNYRILQKMGTVSSYTNYLDVMTGCLLIGSHMESGIKHYRLNFIHQLALSSLPTVTTMTNTLLAVSILVLTSSAAAKPSRHTSELSTNTNSSDVRTLSKAIEIIMKLESELKEVKKQLDSGKGETHTYFPHSHVYLTHS